jgi:hypothetical protein
MKEIILHTLHEHGQLRTQDLESHIKDEIEKENVKLCDYSKRLQQAYEDVRRPRRTLANVADLGRLSLLCLKTICLEMIVRCWSSESISACIAVH